MALQPCVASQEEDDENDGGGFEGRAPWTRDFIQEGCFADGICIRLMFRPDQGLDLSSSS